MLLTIIMIFTLILYFARKFGYMDVIQCVLLAILVFAAFCPENLRNYLFFQLQLDAILGNLPSEVIDPIKIKSLSTVNERSVGEIMFDLKNQVIEILSQKAIVDNTEQLQEQTEILKNIKDELDKGNIIAEVGLEQFYAGQQLEIQQLNSIEKSMAYQTQVLSKDINNPKSVLQSLNSIKANTKSTANMYGELQKNTMTSGQTNKILTEGFKTLLQADNKKDLVSQINNLGLSVDSTFSAYKTKIDATIDAVQKASANEIAEAKQQVDQINKAADLKIAIAEQEKNKALETATNMVNDYRMHENLGTKSHKMIGFNSTENAADNTATQTAAGVGLFTLGAIILSWIF